MVKLIKTRVQSLPCTSLANPNWLKIIETDASNIGYGGILKQVNPHSKAEYLIRFYSGKWTESQKKYATVAHEMLTIVKCVSLYVKVLGEHISSLDTKLDELILLVNKLSTNSFC